MKVIEPLNQVYNFEFIPRKYGSDTVSYTIKNKSQGYEFTRNNIQVSNDTKGYSVIPLIFTDFEVRQKDTLHITIFVDNLIIYKGQIYAQQINNPI